DELDAGTRARVDEEALVAEGQQRGGPAPRGIGRRGAGAEEHRAHQGARRASSIQPVAPINSKSPSAARSAAARPPDRPWQGSGHGRAGPRPPPARTAPPLEKDAGAGRL